MKACIIFCSEQKVYLRNKDQITISTCFFHSCAPQSCCFISWPTSLRMVHIWTSSEWCHPENGDQILCKLVDVDLLFQSLMPLLTSDLYETCKACVEGNLKAHLPQFDCHQTALGVVLVSGGYPGAYPKWKEITGTSVNQASIVRHCRAVECKPWLMCSVTTGAVSAGIQPVLSLCRNTTCAISV